MDSLVTNSMFMMQRSMGFLWEKQTALLENLSNVETPGYKAKYVTFEEALQHRITAAADGAKPVSGVRGALEGARSATRTAQDESARMDGNGVNATEQMVELARNAYQLQFVMSAISSDLATLRSAIRGQ